MSSTNLSEQDLLQRMFLNDEMAFNELFERHWSKVYAVSYRYVRDKEAALEITHDIFLNIWNKRKELTIHSFKNYVLTSASYHSIRHNQRSKAIPLHYSSEDLSDVNPNLYEQNTAETKIMEFEFNSEVNSLLESLPNRCREIYLLSRRENLSIQEISEKLNVSKRTVENQLTTALKHLRSFLKHPTILGLILAILWQIAVPFS